MAQVDFSNAVLDVWDNRPTQPSKPFTEQNYMNFDASFSLYNYENGSYSVINTNGTKTILSNTPSKVSFLYTGEFSVGGTYFLMTNNAIWKVSNISFSAGDTYAFVIDIEVSGNT